LFTPPRTSLSFILLFLFSTTFPLKAKKQEPEERKNRKGDVLNGRNLDLQEFLMEGISIGGVPGTFPDFDSAHFTFFRELFPDIFPRIILQGI